MSDTKLDQAIERPWHVDTICDDGDVIIVNGNGLKSVCVVHAHPHLEICAQANAELIVHAVNSHDALVEALENLIDAAKLVSERWSSGDLADVVRSLDVDRQFAEAAVKLAQDCD